MKKSKSSRERDEQRRIGHKLRIFLENLSSVSGETITQEKFAEAYGFTLAQVQGWTRKHSGAMPASALYRLYMSGQSIDAFFGDGSVTVPIEEFRALLAAAHHLESEMAKAAVGYEIFQERAGDYRRASSDVPTKARKGAEADRSDVPPRGIHRRRK